MNINEKYFHIQQKYFNRSDLSNCSAKEEMERVQGLKTGCLGKFSECKQAQVSWSHHTSIPASDWSL